MNGKGLEESGTKLILAKKTWDYASFLVLPVCFFASEGNDSDIEALHESDFRPTVRRRKIGRHAGQRRLPVCSARFPVLKSLYLTLARVNIYPNCKGGSHFLMRRFHSLAHLN
jgi:hypothetical protein